MKRERGMVLLFNREKLQQKSQNAIHVIYRNIDTRGSIREPTKRGERDYLRHSSL
jgi:hypothetical protein